MSDNSDRQKSILLDVLNEDCHYEEVVELPVDGPFLKVDGTPNMVKVPSVGDILGDKLTAYAPNTTGIPYFKKTQGGNDRDCSMEIIKQLYDIARLFDEVPNLDITSKSFGRIAEVELSYRGLDNNPKLIFDDVRQTSLCLATRGQKEKATFKCSSEASVASSPSCSEAAILLTMPLSTLPVQPISPRCLKQDRQK